MTFAVDTDWGLPSGSLYRLSDAGPWRVLRVGPFLTDLWYVNLGSPTEHGAIFSPTQLGLITFGGVVPVFYDRVSRCVP
jgi:hypothetical protein